MALLSVYILNKAGGLVYQKDFADGRLERLASNDYLVLAGTFHSVHALSARISPTPGSSGISVVETETLALHCLQTLTGVKFLAVMDAGQLAPDFVLRRVHQIYADYAMKNPFHQPEMPIRSEKFERQLAAYVATVA